MIISHANSLTAGNQIQFSSTILGMVLFDEIDVSKEKKNEQYEMIDLEASK
jgi:hypothetical protein